MKISDHLQFPEILVLKKMDFVETENRDKVPCRYEGSDLPLDGMEQSCFGKRPRAGERCVQLLVEIRGSDGRQRKINGEINLLVQGSEQAS